MTKASKTRRRKTSEAKQLRNEKIIAEAVSGKKTTEIAEEMGITRQQVSVILNGDQIRELREQIRNDLHSLARLAVETIRDAMEARSLDMTNAVKAADKVLGGLGIIGRLGQEGGGEQPGIHEFSKLSWDEKIARAERALKIMKSARPVQSSEPFKDEGEEHA